MVSSSSFARIDMILKKSSSLLLGLFAFFLVVITRTHQPALNNASRRLVAPPPQLKHFVFGFNEVVADSLWIRTIQDFDYCDQVQSHNLCKGNSWLYKMLDATTDLSPQFRIPYAAGGLALTVLISDVEGATKIFEKGVRSLPKDWTISYRAAYHYLYEVKDKKRAAELLTQAGDNGAPPWVFSLAGRLYSDSGELELAQQLLQEMKDTNQDPTLIKRLEDKIESMKKAPK